MSTEPIAEQDVQDSNKLGVYTIVESVAETPMTFVYKATDSTDGRSVALRVSNAALLADPDRLRGLLESSNQIASIQNETSSVCSISAERVDGSSLLPSCCHRALRSTWNSADRCHSARHLASRQT